MSNLCPCSVGNGVSAALFQLRRAKDLKETSPEQTGLATVVSRRVDTAYSLTQSHSSWAYYVRFRLDNGEELELQVSEEAYSQLQEGRSGSITWQGSVLTIFEGK